MVNISSPTNKWVTPFQILHVDMYFRFPLKFNNHANCILCKLHMILYTELNQHNINHVWMSIYFRRNKHSDACIYLPPYKLDVLKKVEYKFPCKMEAHVEVTTSLMFDCNTFKDKRHLLILVAITLPSKELQFCNFIMQ